MAQQGSGVGGDGGHERGVCEDKLPSREPTRSRECGGQPQWKGGNLSPRPNSHCTCHGGTKKSEKYLLFKGLANFSPLVRKPHFAILMLTRTVDDLCFAAAKQLSIARVSPPSACCLPPLNNA